MLQILAMAGSAGNLRLEPDSLSPLSARAGFSQRPFLEGVSSLVSFLFLIRITLPGTTSAANLTACRNESLRLLSIAFSCTLTAPAQMRPADATNAGEGKDHGRG